MLLGQCAHTGVLPLDSTAGLPSLIPTIPSDKILGSPYRGSFMLHPVNV